MTTLRKINQALFEKYQGQLSLVKGKEYFYFSGTLASRMYSTCIYSGTLTGTTVESVLLVAEKKLENRMHRVC